MHTATLVGTKKYFFGGRINNELEVLEKTYKIFLGE